MQYLTWTNEELEAYNQLVTNWENYNWTTTRWADIIEINWKNYIAYNEKYFSNLEICTNLEQ